MRGSAYCWVIGEYLSTLRVLHIATLLILNNVKFTLHEKLKRVPGDEGKKH
jgi:hypothetical protein